MSKYAKDSELRHLVDRSIELEKELINEDEFIAREDYFEAELDIAADVIEDSYAKLADKYKDEPDKLKNLDRNSMKDLYKKEFSTEKDFTNDMAKLEKAMNDYDNSNDVLQKIEERKQQISAAVDDNINHVNDHRIESGMKKYKPEKQTYKVRQIKKIEDHFKS
ncbi:MAG: hypothetical protein HRU35_04915 [Rickettsiaceae bacterium]|nr:hypothetical protein [Rickettsiaceae bacterium]